MKRMICSILIIMIVSCILPLSVYAEQRDIIYLEDGSYITVQTEVKNSRATDYVTGSKTYTYYDNNGTSKWKAVLTGTFTYTGSSSTCTASDVDVTIYDSAWYVISQSSGKSGNKATSSVSMGEKLLGITTNRVPVSMTLSCDKNGNLS